MNDRRRALGRGLGALLPTAPPDRAESSGQVGLRAFPGGFGAVASPVDVLIPDPGVDAGTPFQDGTVAAYYAEVPLGAITPNPRQPRQVFDEEAMAELVSSISEVGLLQPVVVRPLSAGRFELVMGERRWRAARDAGLEVLPAIVRAVDDASMLRDALLENLHRSALNPLEEAAAYDQLLRDFGCSHDELAARLGRSRPQISNTLRLLKLPGSVQRRLAAGVLSAGHARALLALTAADDQERLAQRIVAEGLSVRAVEEAVVVADIVDPQPTARARTAPVPVAPRLHDLAARLSDRFETRVTVGLGRRRGKIVVEFASLHDLERIVAVMDAGAGGGSGTEGSGTGGSETGGSETAHSGLNEKAATFG